MTVFIMPYEKYDKYYSAIAENADTIEPLMLYLTDGGVKLSTKKNELKIKNKEPSEAVVIQTDNPKAFKAAVPFIKDFGINYMEVSDKKFENMSEKAVEKIEKDVDNLASMAM